MAKAKDGAAKKGAPKKGAAKKGAAVEEPKAKKGAKKGTPKKGATAVEEPKVKSNRGRKAGVRYAVKKEYSEGIHASYEAMTNAFDEVTDDVNTFLDKGNRVSVSKARKNLQMIVRYAKELRHQLQNAKVDMQEVKI